MEIKIRYTWKNKKSGKIWSAIKRIESVESGFPISMISKYNDLIAKDLWTGVVDRSDKDVFVGDKILDLLTKADYVVCFGICKTYAYTGFYCESDEGRQTTLNPDYDTNKNGAIEVFDNIHINPINTNTNG